MPHAALTCYCIANDLIRQEEEDEGSEKEGSSSDSNHCVISPDLLECLQ